jgi:hypothetical protein
MDSDYFQRAHKYDVLSDISIRVHNPLTRRRTETSKHTLIAKSRLYMGMRTHTHRDERTYHKQKKNRK